jgi:hypothetical protein
MKSKKFIFLDNFFNFLPDRINQKMFVTEDKMVKEMQTLSLELAALKNTNGIPKSTSPIQE